MNARDLDALETPLRASNATRTVDNRYTKPFYVRASVARGVKEGPKGKGTSAFDPLFLTRQDKRTFAKQWQHRPRRRRPQGLVADL